VSAWGRHAPRGVGVCGLADFGGVGGGAGARGLGGGKGGEPGVWGQGRGDELAALSAVGLRVFAGVGKLCGERESGCVYATLSSRISEADEEHSMQITRLTVPEVPGGLTPPGPPSVSIWARPCEPYCLHVGRMGFWLESGGTSVSITAG